MSKTQTAAKAACGASTTSTEHAHERKNEQPCLACDSEYVHSGGLCSRCYNLARNPRSAGKKGDELIAAVKAKLAETKQPKTSKPATSKKRSASKSKPATTEDALAANAELYQARAEQEVTF